MAQNTASDGSSYSAYFAEAIPVDAPTEHHPDSNSWREESDSNMPKCDGGYYASYAPNDLDATTNSQPSHVDCYSSTLSTSWKAYSASEVNGASTDVMSSSSDRYWETETSNSGYIANFSNSDKTEDYEMYDPERSALTYGPNNTVAQGYSTDSEPYFSTAQRDTNEYIPENYVPQEYDPEDHSLEACSRKTQYVPEQLDAEEYVPGDYVPCEQPVKPSAPVYIPSNIIEESPEFDNEEYDPVRPSLVSSAYKSTRNVEKRDSSREDALLGDPAPKKRCSSPDPEFSVFNKKKLPVELGDDELLNPLKRAHGIQKARAQMDAKKQMKTRENSLESGPKSLLSLKQKDIGYLSGQKRSQYANECIKTVAQLNKEIERLERNSASVEEHRKPCQVKELQITSRQVDKQRSVSKPLQKVRKTNSVAQNDEEPTKHFKEAKPVVRTVAPSSSQLPDVVPSTRTLIPNRLSQAGIDKGRKLTAEQLEAAKKLMAKPQIMGNRTVSAKHGVTNARDQLNRRMQQVQKSSGTVVEKSKSKAYQESVSHRTGVAASSNGKRVAHHSLPKTGTCAPIQVSNSQIPTVVRQKCLNTFLEECRKMVSTTSDALEMAQNEERTLCLRASTKSGYLSASVNVLKNLRSMVLKSNGQKSKDKCGPAKAVSHASVLTGRHESDISVGVKRSSREIDKSQKISESELYELLADTFLLTEQQFVDNCYPLWDEECEVPKVRFAIQGTSKNGRGFVADNDMNRTCSRCSKVYQLTLRGGYAQADDCVYHYSRAFRSKQNGSFESRYSCCGADLSVKGCCVSECHVTESLREIELYSFVESPAPTGMNDPRSRKVYAMDCEMVYTVWGPALARVSVVDIHDDLVLDLIVKPNDLIVDCNTRFSGLTIEQLENVPTTIGEAHERLFELINQETILIGHSLESDLKALRMIHPRVVDTSIVFPHRLGPPYKRALRTLTSEILSKIIQEDVSGHDSKEDASACMQLMLHKTKYM